jgi:NADH:ubiquinone oxidoreductase subunit 2 (subunit N)
MITGVFAQYFRPTDYLVCLPLLLLALFAGGLMVMDTMMPRSWRAVNGWAALLGIGFSGAALSRAYLASLTPDHGFVVMNGLFGTLVLDRVTLAAQSALLVAGVLALLVALRRGRRVHELSGAFCASLLFAMLGMMALAGAHDMVLMLVSLQLVVLSLGLLVAVAEPEGNRPPWQSAWKLMLGGTLGTAALAFSFSLLYLLSSQTVLLPAAAKLDDLMRAGSVPQPMLGVIAVSGLMAFGALVALVPFHSWAAPALEHAAPSACVMLAAAPLLSAWPLVIRLFGQAMYPMRTTLEPLFVVLGLVTLVFGTLAMLLQGNLHRFLAYAAMAQTGFLLVGLSISFAGDKPATEGLTGVFAHVPGLALALAACYAVSPMVAARAGRAARIEDLAGLFHRSPLDAALLTVPLLALAGLPCGGFWGRYSQLQGLWNNGHQALAITAGLFWVVALFGYGRLLRRMADRSAAADAYGVPRPLTPGWSLRLVMALSSVALLAASYTGPVQNFVKWMLYL